MSLRGDTIMFKDFKLNIDLGKSNSPQDIFLHHVGIGNSYIEENLVLPTPFFEKENLHFAYVKKAQMFFVVVSKLDQMKPAFALEFLARTVRMITDFCGGLDEELLRNNFVLIYELIDEMVDFGVV